MADVAGAADVAEVGDVEEEASVFTVLRCCFPDRPRDGQLVVSRLAASHGMMCVRTEALPRGPAAFWCGVHLGPEAPEEALLESIGGAVDAACRAQAGVVVSCGGSAGSIGGREAAARGALRRLFEQLGRLSSDSGDVFVVEASLLEIGADGALCDLLAPEAPPHGSAALEVMADPLSPGCFVCEGLKRVPAQSAKEALCLLDAGLQRSGGGGSERPRQDAHRVLTLTVESLSMGTGATGHVAQRGRLVFADVAAPAPAALARCPSLPELLRLAPGGGAPGVAPALALLLRGPLAAPGSEARLVAHVRPELQHRAESLAMLEFVQRVQLAGASPQLLQECEAACAALLDVARPDPEARPFAADPGADNQSRRAELNGYPKVSLEKQRFDEAMVRMAALTQELNEAKASRRRVDSQATELRERLAGAEERARLLQEQQDDLSRERAAFQEERQALRSRGEQWRQRRAAADGALVTQRALVEAARAEAAEAGRLDSGGGGAEFVGAQRRASWAVQAELEGAVADLHRQIEEVRHGSRLQVLKADVAGLETVTQLGRQLSRLDRESAEEALKLSQVYEAHARLETERREADRRREAVPPHGEALQQRRRALEEAKVREAELREMLDELQEELLRVLRSADAADAPTDAASAAG